MSHTGAGSRLTKVKDRASPGDKLLGLSKASHSVAMLTHLEKERLELVIPERELVDGAV